MGPTESIKQPPVSEKALSTKKHACLQVFPYECRTKFVCFVCLTYSLETTRCSQLEWVVSRDHIGKNLTYWGTTSLLSSFKNKLWCLHCEEQSEFMSSVNRVIPLDWGWFTDGAPSVVLWPVLMPDGCSVGVDVYTRSPRSALTGTLSEPGVSAKISANPHDEPFHLDYNQPPSQYLLPQQQAHPEHLGRKFMGKNLRCSGWRQTQFYGNWKKSYLWSILQIH